LLLSPAIPLVGVPAGFLHVAHAFLQFPFDLFGAAFYLLTGATGNLANRFLYLSGNVFCRALHLISIHGILLAVVATLAIIE